MFMSSIDIIFDRSIVYRLQARHSTRHNLFAVLTTKPHLFEDPRNHPIHGKCSQRRVYHAILEGYNSPLRAAPFPPVEVAVKWAKGRNAVERLLVEAGFYQRELRHLQGTVVPIFYGCYTANIEGADVGCLILEWCGGSTMWTQDELYRRRILAACKLHDAGVEHGRLYDPEGRHFVMGMNNTVRIIDFALARSHKCRGAVPQLLGERPGDVPAGCEELEDLEARIGSWSPSEKPRQL